MAMSSALDATVAFGSTGDSALDATMAAPSGPPASLAHAATVASQGPTSGVTQVGLPTSPGSPGSTLGRSTVLPRVESVGESIRIVHAQRDRYVRLKVLGQGGMGEVLLARDEDIDRTVAVKQLLPGTTDAAGLARFVEEVRTIGRLEHPNIVPIHDVGVDEQGRYFFVMKYVEGETLEQIIERLAAGDPDYHRRYPFEVRMELCIGLLRALQFAHNKGVVHRDVKPANVMVGRYGEVVLMDWGVAKPLDAGHELPTVETPEPSSERQRMFHTRQGALVGTPAYMSPEQAQGKPVDERSDVYSAVVLIDELMSLQHYCAHATTLPAMLQAVVHEPPAFFKLAARRSTAQGPMPAELAHLVHKGLEKDPAQRFQSATEVIDRLYEILEGKVRVQCQITFTKRMFREAGRLVDRRPFVGFGFLVTCVLLVLAAIGVLIRQAVV